MSTESESSPATLLKYHLAEGITFSSEGWEAGRTIKAAELRAALKHAASGSTDPLGLRIAGIDIEGKVDLRYMRSAVAFSAWNCRFLGGLILDEAQFPSLTLNGCEFLGGAGDPPLSGFGLRSAGSVWLYRSTFRTSEDRVPAIQLSGARVEGALDLSGCELFSATGPALMAERITVDGPIYLRTGDERESFSAIGAGQNGVVRLFNAHVASELTCTVTSRDASVVIKNTSGGPAISAQGLRTDGGLTLGGSFSGSGPNGAVRLLEAQIGGDLIMDRLMADNPTGPAINAERVCVDGALIVVGRSCVLGAQEEGALRLFHSSIASGARFRDIFISNTSGPAIDAREMRVGAELDLNASTYRGRGTVGVLRLDGATVSGTLYCDNAVVDSWQDTQMGDATGLAEVDGWAVDGLTYEEICAARTETASWKTWLAILRHRTPHHAAQPYVHLASIYRARGDDATARTILIAERDARAARTEASPVQRSWTTLTKLLLGYGYKPWRALIWLLVVLTLSTALSVSLGSASLQTTAVNQQSSAVIVQGPQSSSTARQTSTVGPCGLFDRVSYGLDLGAPFLATKGKDRCQTIDTTGGHVLGATSWLLQILSWGLAALFIAGFTNAVRKT